MNSAICWIFCFIIFFVIKLIKEYYIILLILVVENPHILEQKSEDFGNPIQASVLATSNIVENIGKYPSNLNYLLDKEDFFKGIVGEILDGYKITNEHIKKYREDFFEYENYGVEKELSDRNARDSLFLTLVNFIKENYNFVEIFKIINNLEKSENNSLNFYFLDDLEDDDFFGVFFRGNTKNALNYFEEKKGNKEIKTYKFSEAIKIQNKNGEYILIYNYLLGNEDDEELANIFNYFDDEDTFLENGRYIIKIKNNGLLEKIIEQKELLKNEKGDKYSKLLNTKFDNRYLKDEYKTNFKERFKAIDNGKNKDFILPLTERITKDVDDFFEGIEDDRNFYAGLDINSKHFKNIKNSYILDLNYFYNEINKFKNGGDFENGSSYGDDIGKNFFTFERYQNLNKESYFDKFISFFKIKLTLEEEKEIINILQKKNNKNNFEKKLLKFLEKYNEKFSLKITEKQQKELKEKNNKNKLEEELLDFIEKNKYIDITLNDFIKNKKFLFSDLAYNNSYFQKIFNLEEFNDIKHKVKQQNNKNKKVVEKLKKTKINYTVINQENLFKYNLDLILKDVFKLYQLSYLGKDFIENNDSLSDYYLEKRFSKKHILNFLDDIKNELSGLKDDENLLNLHIFSDSNMGVSTLYEKIIDEDSVYVGAVNSLIGIGFDSMKEVINTLGKEKNIKIFVADLIGGEKHENEWLREKYEELGFVLQKDEKGNNLKDSWGKNNRNSDLIMIREKG